MLHTACKVLALRDEPRAEFAAWTPRGLNATPAKRGLFDTTWLALLARRCECSHVDDSTRHQAIDEMIAVVAGRRDWDAAKRLARLCVGSVAEGGADEGADEGADGGADDPPLDPRAAVFVASALADAVAEERKGEMIVPGTARAATLTTLSSLADVALGMMTTTPAARTTAEISRRRSRRSRSGCSRDCRRGCRCGGGPG